MGEFTYWFERDDRVQGRVLPDRSGRLAGGRRGHGQNPLGVKGRVGHRGFGGARFNVRAYRRGRSSGQRINHLTSAHGTHKPRSMALTTAQDCAERWGVSMSTAHLILASLDSIDRNAVTGVATYDQSAADAARAERSCRPRRTRLTAPGIAREDLQRLSTDEAIPVAHRALWALLWEGELHIREALSLDTRDVDPDRQQVRVSYAHKGKGARTIPLSDRTAALARAAAAGRTGGPFLVNEGGRALSRKAATRGAARTSALGIQGFRRGGREVRGGERPRIRVARLSTGRIDAISPNACLRLCAGIHPSRPDSCLSTADAELLVDLTIECPMTGEVEDQRLRPFCRGCYDAIRVLADRRQGEQRRVVCSGSGRGRLPSAPG